MIGGGDLGQAAAPGTTEVFGQVGALVGRGGQGPHHQQQIRRGLLQQWAHQMPQPALHPRTDDGIPDGFGYDKAHPGPGGAVVRCRAGSRRGRWPGCGVHHQGAATSPHPASYGETELGRRSHPVLGRQHLLQLPEKASAQPASFARPLRRREDRMERPARVRIRRRNPWVRLRRRLLGWKVRLLTGSLPNVEIGQNAGLQIQADPQMGHLGTGNGLWTTQRLVNGTRTGRQGQTGQLCPEASSRHAESAQTGLAILEPSR